MTVTVSKRLLDEYRRMLRRDFELFFFGTAILLSSRFKIFENQKRVLFYNLGARTPSHIPICTTVGADSFAVFFAKRLERDLESELLAHNIPKIDVVVGNIRNVDVLSSIIRFFVGIKIMRVPGPPMGLADRTFEAGVFLVRIDMSHSRSVRVLRKQGFKPGARGEGKVLAASAAHELNGGLDFA